MQSNALHLINRKMPSKHLLTIKKQTEEEVSVILFLDRFAGFYICKTQSFKSPLSQKDCVLQI